METKQVNGSIHFASHGRAENPALVCIPGLLGGPENFVPFLPDLTERFHVIIPDPNAERRDLGLSALTTEVMQEVSFTSTAVQIKDLLRELGHQSSAFLGLSIGGKIVYDFASRFPEQFGGAVITDVGVDPFEDSILFKRIYGFVTEAPLHLPWPEMKEALKVQIEDRNLRSLIQTQLSYPDQKPPAVWKIAMKNFGAMLANQSIGHQYDALAGVDEQLATKGRHFHILIASEMSGVSEECMAKLKTLKSFKIHPIRESSHFLHITHKDLLTSMVLDL